MCDASNFQSFPFSDLERRTLMKINEDDGRYSMSCGEWHASKIREISTLCSRSSLMSKTAQFAWNRYYLKNIIINIIWNLNSQFKCYLVLRGKEYLTSEYAIRINLNYIDNFLTACFRFWHWTLIDILKYFRIKLISIWYHFIMYNFFKRIYWFFIILIFVWRY